MIPTLPAELSQQILDKLGDDKETLLRLLQVSRSMYSITLPLYYSRIDVSSIPRFENLYCYLNSHQDKKISGYVKQFKLGDKQNYNGQFDLDIESMEVIVRGLERMENLEKLYFPVTMFHSFQTRPDSLAQKERLLQVLMRLKFLEVSNEHSFLCPFDSEWIQHLDALKSLRIQRGISCQSFVLPKNIQLLFFYGHYFQSPDDAPLDSPCLMRNSLTHLNIQLSKFADYLFENLHRGFNFNILPNSLTHVTITVDRGFNPCEGPFTPFFWLFLPQTSIVYLHLQVCPFKSNERDSEYVDFGFENWINALPESLTSLIIQCVDTRNDINLDDDDEDKDKDRTVTLLLEEIFKYVEALQNMSPEAHENLNKLKEATILWNLRGKGGLSYEWDRTQSKFSLEGWMNV